MENEGESQPVSRILYPVSTGWWSSIWDRRYRRPLAAYPSLERCGPQHRLLFGLAPGGVYQAGPVTRTAGGLLPHLFTLAHRRRMRHSAGGRFPFLWHFPSGRPAWALPSSLPFGVRTFLGRGLGRARDHPADSLPKDYLPPRTASSTWAHPDRKRGLFECTPWGQPSALQVSGGFHIRFGLGPGLTPGVENEGL